MHTNENQRILLRSTSDIFVVCINLIHSLKKKSSGFIRSELARSVNLRNTPELIFELDDSIEYGARIDSILKEILPKKED